MTISNRVLPICMSKLSKNIHLLSVEVKCWFSAVPLKEQSLSWGGMPTSVATQYCGRKKKSTCSFLLVIKDDTSVFKYPQDVHSREAKIYSPEESMKSNLIILQKASKVKPIIFNQNAIYTLLYDLFAENESIFHYALKRHILESIIGPSKVLIGF